MLRIIVSENGLIRGGELTKYCSIFKKYQICSLLIARIFIFQILFYSVSSSLLTLIINSTTVKKLVIALGKMFNIFIVSFGRIIYLLIP